MVDSDLDKYEEPDECRPSEVITHDKIDEIGRESKRYWAIGLIMGALLGIITNVMVNSMFARSLDDDIYYFIFFSVATICLIIVIYAMYRLLIKNQK
jgi:hypothetical protein